MFLETTSNVNSPLILQCASETGSYLLLAKVSN